MAASEPLALLLKRLRQSQDCLADIAPLLPAGLRAQVQPGPLEDGSWCMLVDSGAAAAKLRQMLPSLQARLQERGRAVTTIRVRVQRPAALR